MKSVRIFYTKLGRMKFVSHLDMNRLMIRVIRKSGIPVWYTEGFNPHPYYSFALALSLGFESSCEILDFNLNEEMPYDEIRNQIYQQQLHRMSLRTDPKNAEEGRDLPP